MLLLVWVEVSRIINTSGFITCFATENIAAQYVLAIDDLDEIESERQDRCAVVIKISSLL